jgi:hypothetical protein
LAGEKSLAFKGVTSRARSAYVQIAYTNGSEAPRLAELRVNGQIATRIAFPSTGDEHTVGSITVEAPLEASGKNNVLTFTSVDNTRPGVVWIDVLPGPHEYRSHP